MCTDTTDGVHWTIVDVALGGAAVAANNIHIAVISDRGAAVSGH